MQNILKIGVIELADNTITLLDHPDDPGYIDGEYTGNGKHILFLIQSKKDLQEARKHLKAQRITIAGQMNIIKK